MDRRPRPITLSQGAAIVFVTDDLALMLEFIARGRCGQFTQVLPTRWIATDANGQLWELTFEIEH